MYCQLLNMKDMFALLSAERLVKTQEDEKSCGFFFEVDGFFVDGTDAMFPAFLHSALFVSRNGRYLSDIRRATHGQQHRSHSLRGPSPPLSPMRSRAARV